jgi:hypothetical protein
MKHRAFLLALVLPLVLSSCIGIDADAKVGTDGAVDLALRYTVSSAVDELGKLGANAAYMPLPVGQSDLELAAARAGGQVRSWSRKDGGDSFTVAAALRFPNAASFALFIDPLGKLATYSEAGGKSTLGITFTEGSAPADPQLLDFLRVAFADYLVSMRITLPKAASSSGGFAVSGKTASFSMKAADLYASPTPVQAVVSW